jgi:thioredoxin reductase
MLDTDFLRKLDESKCREVYARITALSLKELPLEYIEGKVTGGSINIDGTSAVRRTCNLSLVAADININNFYWGLNNKFKLDNTNVYFIGDGAGKAGNIVTAAATGLVAARDILERK